MKLLRSNGLQLIVLGLAIFGPSSAQAQGTPIQPAHPVTTAQVKELMETSHALDRMKDGMHKMVAQQKAAVPYFPETFWSDFEAEFAKLDWIAISTPIYQKYLSEEDALKIIAFYKTDAGQRSLDAGFAVSTEMTQAGFERGKAIGTELAKKYQQQIQENLRKAQQSASPAAPK